MKESESSFGHKIVDAAAGSEEVAGSDDNSTALAVGKIEPSHKRICLSQVDGGVDEDQMMMQPPPPIEQPLCLCHTRGGSLCHTRGGINEDQTHQLICPLYDDGDFESGYFIYGPSDSDSNRDSDCNSDSDSDSYSDYECPPDDDTDSDDGIYDSYYDDMPSGKSRDRINKFFKHEMELAADQACKDLGGGLKLEDFQMVKSLQQTTGIAMSQYMVFRAKNSSDGKISCYVAKVSISYYNESTQPVETVEFVRQMDDVDQVTETEWPQYSRGIRGTKK